MGDPTKFQYLYEYYAFNVSLLLLVISEIVIYVYTNFRHQNGKSLRRDLELSGCYTLILCYASWLVFSVLVIGHHTL